MSDSKNTSGENKLPADATVEQFGTNPTSLPYQPWYATVVNARDGLAAPSWQP